MVDLEGLTGRGYEKRLKNEPRNKLENLTMMKRSLLTFLGGAIAVSTATVSNAAEILVEDFVAPNSVHFVAPVGFLSEGQIFDVFTVNSPSGAGLTSFPENPDSTNCFEGCIATNTFNGEGLIFTLSEAFDQVGLFLGQIVPYALNVSFFDSTDTLLGTVNVSNDSSNGGLSFAGFQSSQGISSITVSGTDNGTRIAVQSALTSAVPEPATWAMFLLGFGAIGYSMRRRKGTTAQVSFA